MDNSILAEVSAAFTRTPWNPDDDIKAGRLRQQMLDSLGMWDLLLAGRRADGDPHRIDEAKAAIARLEKCLGLRSGE